MGHRVTKGNTLKADVFTSDRCLGKSFGKILRKPKLLVIRVWCDVKLEEWTITTLFKSKI